MKLLSREPDRLVFRLTRREHDALLVVLRLRTHLPRGARPLASDTPREDRLREAEADLTEALKEHRDELTQGVESLLADPERCSAQKQAGYRLVLTDADREMLLQALNELRVGAWEKLGCPELEPGERPELSAENFLCYWAMQVADMFQGNLLAALHGED